MRKNHIFVEESKNDLTMKMTSSEELQAFIVENAVCEYFKVDISEVICDNKKKYPTRARHFIVYILHSEFGISVSKLADRYKLSIAGINFINRRMNFLVREDNLYRNLHKEISGRY